MEEEWRGTESKVCDVVGSPCFIKCNVSAAVYQELIEHFILPPADKPYFLFQQDLDPAQSLKSTTRFAAWVINVLNWPVNLPELNPVEWGWVIAQPCHREAVQGIVKLRNTQHKNKHELKVAIKAMA